MVETLETATSWSNLGALHAAVRAALPGPAGRLPRLAPVPDRRVAVLHRARPPRRRGSGRQWRAAKTAATDAIVAAGGTITHHHAVGRDHAPWLAAEIGDLGVELLRAVKERCDPAGVMNPGKLLSNWPFSPRR